MQMFKMEKNYYQKPLMVVETFVANEFVVTCNWSLITNDSNWLNNSNFKDYYHRYVDINENGSFDIGEQFVASTGHSTSTTADRSTEKALGFGKLQRKNGSNWTQYQHNTTNLTYLSGQSYDTTEFSNGGYTCRFSFTSSNKRWYKVINNVLYYQDSTTHRS